MKAKRISQADAKALGFKSAEPWDRLLWGVELSTPRGDPILIGSLWHREAISAYPEAPTRALLFWTRKEARAWCKLRMEGYPEQWQFRPVRVRETVRKV